MTVSWPPSLGDALGDPERSSAVEVGPAMLAPEAAKGRRFASDKQDAT